jgi:hypothetical protein
MCRPRSIGVISPQLMPFQPTEILAERPMHRADAYRMVRWRMADAGVKGKLGCYVFRATGITAYLEAGGTIENA